MEIKKTERENFTLLEIVLQQGEVMEPRQLPHLLEQVGEVDAKKGVVLSGRMPVWAFAALVHHFHPVSWVATHDPRLGGAVVVESHTTARRVGEVIPL